MQIKQARLLELWPGDRLYHSSHDLLIFPATQTLAIQVDEQQVAANNQQFLFIPANKQAIATQAGASNCLIIEVEKVPSHFTNLPREPLDTSRELQKYCVFLQHRLCEPMSQNLEKQVYEVLKILLETT